MKKVTQILMGLSLTVFLLGGIGDAFSADPKANKKRGRVYYKMVCTVCHINEAARAIPPASLSMAEWRAYLNANKHDVSGKSNPEVTYYVSREYRESIKDTNKAARKFLKLSDEQIAADVRAFVVGGAKDSDTPASCN